MGFVVARKHARRLRAIALVLFGLVPVLAAIAGVGVAGIARRSRHAAGRAVGTAGRLRRALAVLRPGAAPGHAVLLNALTADTARRHVGWTCNRFHWHHSDPPPLPLPTMLGVLGLALLGGPFLTLPSPALQWRPDADRHCERSGADAAVLLFDALRRRGVAGRRLRRRRSRCTASAGARRKSLRLPGSQRYAQLSAPATPRESRGNYSNDFRIGTRYGVQAMRDGPTPTGPDAGRRLPPGTAVRRRHQPGRPGAARRAQLRPEDRRARDAGPSACSSKAAAAKPSSSSR